MIIKLPVASCRLQVPRCNRVARKTFSLQPSAFSLHPAFSLVEVLLVVSLLSLIILALMSVFNMTQNAFRASVTQTDVLENSRAAVDLITSDLRALTPSGSTSNAPVNTYYFTNAVNFYANTNLYYTQPLLQSLPGSAIWRTNVLENFFILSRDNRNGQDVWVGTGYAVDLFATNNYLPLHRFTMATNVSAGDPVGLFNTYMAAVVANVFTNAGWSHIMDGVVQLTIRAYDTNGYWMNNYVWPYTSYKNVRFAPPVLPDVVGTYFFGNSLPAAVEVQLGVLEDATVRRAESLPNNLPLPAPKDRRTLYLQAQSGKTHLFRQRVTIPNLDPSAYQ